MLTTYSLRKTETLGENVTETFITLQDLGYFPNVNQDTTSRNNLQNVPTGAIIFNTTTGTWQGYKDGLGWYDFTMTAAP